MSKPAQGRRRPAASGFGATATSPPSSPTSPKPRRRLPSPPRSSSSPFVSDLAGEECYYNAEGSGGSGGNDGPRVFSYSVKQQCWEKAEGVKGRDPDRWRRDALGNVVFRKLVGCPGCYCHDYDHIIPFSKGGKSTLENCQVLRASVNRSKGNKTDISKAELIQRSIQKTPSCRVPSDREMDFMELSAYGNVRRGHDSGGCNIQ